MVDAILVPSGETVMLFSSWKGWLIVKIGLGAVPEFCFDILGLEPGVELELVYADCCTDSFHPLTAVIFDGSDTVSTTIT